ncbi:MAG: hypothetical protein ABIJ91_04630 [Candidatus Kuenenbacteria bacterium]
MNKSHKKYIAIIIGLTILAVVLIFGVIIPAKQNMKNSRNQIMDKYKHLQSLLNGGQGIDKMKANYELIKSNQHILDDVFLYSGQELGFITDLEGLAKKHKMEQTISFLTDKMTERDGMNIIPLNLSLNGNFNDFMNYLNDLDALDYYINLELIEMSKEMDVKKISSPKRMIEDDLDESAEKTSTKLNISLSGLTYWH